MADIKNPILGWDWLADNAIEIRHHHVRGSRKYFLPINGKRVYLAMAKSKANVGVHAVDGDLAATSDSYQRWSQQQLVRATAAAAADAKPVPHRYKRLLAKFPGIGTPNFKAQPLATHEIDTGTNKPCTAKVRPLAPGTRKHDLGKQAFDGPGQAGRGQAVGQ